jgi:hypothetical protein
MSVKDATIDEEIADPRFAVDPYPAPARLCEESLCPVGVRAEASRAE